MIPQKIRHRSVAARPTNVRRNLQLQQLHRLPIPAPQHPAQPHRRQRGVCAHHQRHRLCSAQDADRYRREFSGNFCICLTRRWNKQTVCNRFLESGRIDRYPEGLAIVYGWQNEDRSHQSVTRIEADQKHQGEDVIMY